MFVYYDKNNFSVKYAHLREQVYDNLGLIEINDFDPTILNTHNVRIKNINPLMVEYHMKTDFELKVVDNEILQAEHNMDLDLRLTLIELGM